MMDEVEAEAVLIDVTDADVDAAQEARGGDARATIKVLLVAGQLLEREPDEALREASRGARRRTRGMQGIMQSPH